ncbi:protein translocase subunit SecF [Phreatobacter oligotrophus]|uniref:Protein-export membrane protein SecF n=1 Tax=Phreatobacter oligotrophus TaxID=1122261 RepID=A0A2T4Z503_9HYPH|nr:protein translocase subunit SecF [Phreatobacter oligotrophus]MBX9989732.1 protein translocase subunit SecF [Phreatobacter oligotrophus]PTM56968.1 protein translocase subunit secF [Phreatobacter oligotrophus]
MRLLRLIPDDTKFGFMRFRPIAFGISAFIAAATIIGFLTIGLNIGIDFKGGTLVELQTKQGNANLSELRTRLQAANVGDVQLQEFGGPNLVMLRYGEQPGGERGQQAALRRVTGLIEADYDIRRTEVVGPTVSAELVQMSVIGVILSILAVLIYLWFRFEWQFAVAAMIATLHDVTAIMAFYIFTQSDFDITSIASVLTIIGYSLNDTVVVFDRIREMMRKHKKMPVAELLDIAINSTLSRTTITATTTFLALLGLFFFGGEVIQGFTASMLVGVIIGTYSSIFIASPILIYLGLRTGGFGATRQAEEEGDAAAKARA